MDKVLDIIMQEIGALVTRRPVMPKTLADIERLLAAARKVIGMWDQAEPLAEMARVADPFQPAPPPEQPIGMVLREVTGIARELVTARAMESEVRSIRDALTAIEPSVAAKRPGAQQMHDGFMDRLQRLVIAVPPWPPHAFTLPPVDPGEEDQHGDDDGPRVLSDVRGGLPAHSDGGTDLHTRGHEPNAGRTTGDPEIPRGLPEPRVD